jgi:hypothetical protein
MMLEICGCIIALGKLIPLGIAIFVFIAGEK